MNTPPKNKPERVLVVGRSANVLVTTVDILRAKGYSADATNQFDQVLDDYDVTDLDVLVFGGMVLPAQSNSCAKTSPNATRRVTFVQGLAGIAGLIAAQVQAAISAEAPDSCEVAYDAAQRSVQLTLNGSAPVTVEAWWATSFVPPEPKSASIQLFDGQLDAGSHIIPLPRAGAVRSILRRCHRRPVRPRFHRRPHAQCRHTAGTDLGQRQSTSAGQPGHDEHR